MRPVDQTIVTKGTGDCQRAVLASLFHLDIDQVPNFRKYDNETWFKVFWHFLLAIGWEYRGCTSKPTELLLEDSIDGYFSASVKSKTFEGVTHAVILDMTGTVVHDPNPNKLWQGINVLESGEINDLYIILPERETK